MVQLPGSLPLTWGTQPGSLVLDSEPITMSAGDCSSGWRYTLSPSQPPSQMFLNKNQSYKMYNVFKHCEVIFHKFQSTIIIQKGINTHYQSLCIPL